MRLAEVMEGFGHLTTGTANANQRHISGITCDSRQVEPGFLFAAIPGTRMDGRDFIHDAIKRGAIAVLGPPGTSAGEANPDFPIITDEDPRRLYALMAARFFENQPKTIAAITGTSGKTSSAHFLRQIWNGLGLAAGAMGTLGVRATGPAGDDLLPADDKALTTPDAADLHRQLRQLAELGIDNLAMEASSHGLDQRRLDGVRISAAAFTNLSHDHLDYHATEAAYLAAKLRLFEELLIDGGTAVVNADQAYADAVVSICQRRGLPVLRYGENGDRVRLVSREVRADGQALALDVDGTSFDAALPLAGEFQASNALSALALALACGAAPADAVATLPALRGAPGRMEWIGVSPAGAGVYVDYAHKPAALRAVLTALRPHVAGKLCVVFGCGGDRDAQKRPVMGEIAAGLADKVVVTDDNPRGEDAAAIRQAVLQGCPAAMEIGDRAAAIAAGLDGLGAGDVLVVAGKGHESGQIVGDEVLPFNDADVVRGLIGGGA